MKANYLNINLRYDSYIESIFPIYVKRNDFMHSILLSGITHYDFLNPETSYISIRVKSKYHNVITKLLENHIILIVGQ